MLKHSRAVNQVNVELKNQRFRPPASQLSTQMMEMEDMYAAMVLNSTQTQLVPLEEFSTYSL
jgi:hypothetical protein